MTQGNDIALFWGGWGADIRAQAGDLLPENELVTAVILSLFCDAPARDDDVIPDGTTNKRGWWADSVAPMPATGLALREESGPPRALGSRLWLLSRELQLPEVLRRAKDYAQEALQWLMDDGIASAVVVTPANPRQGLLDLHIVITLIDGAKENFALAYQYI